MKLTPDKFLQLSEDSVLDFLKREYTERFLSKVFIYPVEFDRNTEQPFKVTYKTTAGPRIFTVKCITDLCEDIARGGYVFLVTVTEPEGWRLKHPGQFCQIGRYVHE